MSLLLLHIIIATVSVALAIWAFIKPSQRLVRSSYGLSGATALSGVLLVIQRPSQLLHVCIVGSLFIAVTLTLTSFAQRRLATE